jgi:hypothetical protein
VASIRPRAWKLKKMSFDPRMRFFAGLLLVTAVAGMMLFRGPLLRAAHGHTSPNAPPHDTSAGTSDQASAVETEEVHAKSKTDQAHAAASGAPEQETAGEVHTARKGDSVESLARHYLSQTDYMTSGELASAIRAANGLGLVKALQPGQQVVIPGFESTPIVEKPVLIPKDLEMRGIYLTGWTAGSVKGLELIRRWRDAGGNAVVFDAKDFDGLVNVPFSHPLVPRQPHILIHNLPKFARFLHSLGLHSIARIALFRDEFLVQQHPELAVRSRRSGRPWRENGKLVWTDPSRPEVQEYNLALARMVASSGIDEIQFDYVRFPAEGDQEDARFAFESAHPDWERSDVISDFLSRAYNELHPLGVLVSIDVFGVMAWQREIDLDHTGQDIPAMARHCDILSPMVYPSHFFGMDGYTRPGDAPEHFIGASMERFHDITAGTGVVLRPWLQAFAWRTPSYSPAYILTQVSVAKRQEGVGFLFWNARNDYTKVFPAMAQMRAKPGHSFEETRSALSAPKSRPKNSQAGPAE